MWVLCGTVELQVERQGPRDFRDAVLKDSGHQPGTGPNLARSGSQPAHGYAARNQWELKRTILHENELTSP